MRRNVVPWLKVAVCGVVACGYLALLTTLMFPPVILLPIAAAVVAMPFAERLQKAEEWYTQVTTGLAVLALFGILASGPALGAINTVVGLMMLVQIHALLHIKRQRHYGYLVLMTFSQVMAASMMSPSPEIGLVFIILVVFTIWALVLLDIFRSTEEEGEVLIHGSLDFEARNGALRESGGRTFRRNMIGWISGLALASIALSTGLFFVIPRTEAGAFGTQDILPIDEFTTGVSGEIDLRSAGRITEDRTALMNVRFPELPGGRFNGPLYWRVTSFDKYAGDAWSRAGLTSSGNRLFQRSARFAAHPESERGSEEGVFRADYAAKNTVQFEAFLVDLPGEGVPVLSLPLMVQPQTKDAGLWSWDPGGDFTVRHLHRGESGIAYKGVSAIEDSSPAQLRKSREDFRDLMNRRDYAMLTEHNLLPDTIATVHEVTADADTLYDRLNAIQQYLSSSLYRYSLQVPVLPERNPVDAFIRDIRTGHCQLFATSMALMARSEGIPCRLVSGYRGGQYDEGSESYTISANMAHVWVEVFFPDHGWIVFDPSPILDDPGVFSFQSIQSTYSNIALQLQLFWLRNIVGYNASERNLYLGSLDQEESSPREIRERPESTRMGVIQTMAGSLPRLILGLVLGTLIISSILIARSSISARRSLSGLNASQVRAVKLYRLLRKRLARFGVQCEGKTAEEIRSLAAELHAPLETALAPILARYNAARFGLQELTPHEFKSMRQELRSVRVGAS